MSRAKIGCHLRISYLPFFQTALNLVDTLIVRARKSLQGLLDLKIDNFVWSGEADRSSAGEHLRKEYPDPIVWYQLPLGRLVFLYHTFGVFLIKPNGVFAVVDHFHRLGIIPVMVCATEGKRLSMLLCSLWLLYMSMVMRVWFTACWKEEKFRSRAISFLSIPLALSATGFS